MPSRSFRFWSDTNQRVFEDALDGAGVTAELGASAFEIVLFDPPEWLEDLARELGADCS